MRLGAQLDRLSIAFSADRVSVRRPGAASQT